MVDTWVGVGVIGLLIVGCLIWLWWYSPPDTSPWTGREKFEETDRPTDTGENAVATDRVLKKDPAAPSTPKVTRDTSACLWGQTGNGKSVTAKSLAMDWPAGMTIAHAVSEMGTNEFGEWYRSRGYDVVKISTQNSTHRWDPFLDFDESLADFQNVSEGLFHARSAPSTGWDEGAKVVLLASLIVTDAHYDDFAKLPEVLEMGPEEIANRISDIDGVELISTQLELLDDGDRQTMFNRVANRLLPLLSSDIFDEDLPRVSLSEEFEKSHDDRVLLCDSIRDDRAARGFWRFFLETAIDRSYKTEAEQRFLLDEADKLPEIANLGELASAGRTANSRGIIIAQNVDQLYDIYGKAKTRTIWANCPNRFMFRPGDRATADLAIDAVGEYELKRRSVSESEDEDGDMQQSYSYAMQTGAPIVSSELFDLGVGQAFVQSPEGWWIAKLTERDVSPLEAADDGESIKPLDVFGIL